MRLICGIFHLDGTPAHRARLDAMIAQMDVPRLKPRIRTWHRDCVALSILDFDEPNDSALPLPERNASVIAADVRLDEPEAMQKAAGVAVPVTDDALLLALLETHGPTCLGQVLGDFAFASWDQNRGRLICGRDAFGIRPFSYAYEAGKLFAFASLPRALHGGGIVAKTIDEAAVTRRIMHIFDGEDCLIVGIKRLPAAHVLEVSRSGLSLTRYWQLDRANLGSARRTPQEAAGELRNLINQAVSCRLPSRGEVGAHLSGGLDSSAISVLAARQLRAQGRRLHAYSFLDRQRDDISPVDEIEFVNAVLDQEGDIDWTPIRPPPFQSTVGGPMDPDKMFPLGADEPESVVCTRAEQQYVRLVLSGWGGDQGATFAGAGALAELLLRGRWRTLAREIGAFRRERGMSVWAILRSEVFSILLNAELPRRVLNLVRRFAGKEPDFRTRLLRSLTPIARRQSAISERDAGTANSLGTDARVNSWRLLTSPHIADRAEIWAQFGAAHGLAFAFPLLDRRVVEFALSLPSEFFVRGGFRRRLFRDATVGVLPDRVRIRHQKYVPFPSSLLDLAEHKDELLARVDAYAKDRRVNRLIDVDQLRRDVEAYPDPPQLCDRLRRDGNITPEVGMIVVVRMLMSAAYLAQHATAHQDWSDGKSEAAVAAGDAGRTIQGRPNGPA
jgi:asparagine synthase (glutamine-hydrolysing)